MQLNVIVDDGLMQQVRQVSPQSEQELIEAALKVWLALHTQPSRETTESPRSCYDLAKHLIGAIQTPTDLSTNKAYFEGFGK